MKIDVEKARMLKASSSWIHFILVNTDIMSRINKDPLILHKDVGNRFNGKIFGVDVILEILGAGKPLPEGEVNIVADVSMPINLGHTHTVVYYRYRAIDSQTTMVDLKFTLETKGLIMGIYAACLRPRIDSYLEKVLSHNELAAQFVAEGDKSLENSLTEEQNKRISDFRTSSSLDLHKLAEDKSTIEDLKVELPPERIWDAELSELCELYKGFQGQANSLHAELDRIQKTQDAVATLLITRRMLEVIVTQLCESVLKRPRGTEPMASIIDKLDRVEKIPDYVFTSMRNLNRLSTYGAHPKNFSPRQVRESLIALCSIMEWYVSNRAQILNEHEEEEHERGKLDAKVEEYRSLCKGAWLDGIVNDCERELLEKKRIELGFSQEEAQAIESEYVR